MQDTMQCRTCEQSIPSRWCGISAHNSDPFWFFCIVRTLSGHPSLTVSHTRLDAQYTCCSRWYDIRNSCLSLCWCYMLQFPSIKRTYAQRSRCASHNTIRRVFHWTRWLPYLPKRWCDHRRVNRPFLGWEKNDDSIDGPAGWPNGEIGLYG